jgi:lipopolysaccharide export system protein LptA
MIERHNPGSALRLWLGIVAVATAGVLLASPLEAQTLTNSFGGLSKNSNEPIDIESDVLVVHDQQKYATFTGNVKAVQGTTTLRAEQLDVHYVGGGDSFATGETKPAAGAAAPAPEKPAPADAPQAQQQAQITKIEAKGNVIITSEQDQTTTSDWALYDVPAQLVTVGGNVVLTQGQNVLKGDRLVIDLKTGESRFENPGTNTAGGRIRALFVPKAQEGATGGKSDDAKSGAAKPSAAAAESGETAGPDQPDANAAEPAGSGSDSLPAPQSGKSPADSQPWSLIPGVAQ